MLNKMVLCPPHWYPQVQRILWTVSFDSQGICPKDLSSCLKDTVGTTCSEYWAAREERAHGDGPVCWEARPTFMTHLAIRPTFHATLSHAGYVAVQKGFIDGIQDGWLCCRVRQNSLSTFAVHRILRGGQWDQMDCNGSKVGQVPCGPWRLLAGGEKARSSPSQLGWTLE